MQEQLGYVSHSRDELLAAKRRRMKKWRLIVRNLPFETSVDELRARFASHGELVEVLLPEKNGPKGGYGFVQFRRFRDAYHAMKNLNATNFGVKTKSLALAEQLAQKSPESGFAKSSAKRAVNKREQGEGTNVSATLGFSARQIKQEPGSVKVKQLPGLVVQGRKFSACVRTKQEPTAIEVKREPVSSQQLAHVSPSRDERLAAKHRRMKKWRLIVRNLPFETSADELRALFASQGELVEVLLPEKSGQKAGYAFVQFRRFPDANRAMSDLHARNLGGRLMSVDWALASNTYMSAQLEQIDKTKALPLAEKSAQKVPECGFVKSSTKRTANQREKGEGRNVSAKLGITAKKIKQNPASVMVKQKPGLVVQGQVFASSVGIKQEPRTIEVKREPVAPVVSLSTSMKPKRSEKLSYDDLCAIDLLCRQSLKKFLQSLTPEKLKELFVSSNYAKQEEPLPKHLRLEVLVVHQYRKNKRLNINATKNRDLKATAPPSIAHGKVVASKNIPLPVGDKPPLKTTRTLSATKSDVKPGNMTKRKKIGIHSARRKTMRQLTVVSGDLPSAKAIADYRCEWPGCKTRRASLANVRAHMNIHLKTFKCTVCKRCFESAGHLLRHYVCHDALRPFKCRVCGRAFKLEATLNTHFKRRHSNEEKPFKCPDCTASAWTHQNICKHRVAIHHWNWRNDEAE